MALGAMVVLHLLDGEVELNVNVNVDVNGRLMGLDTAGDVGQRRESRFLTLSKCIEGNSPALLMAVKPSVQFAALFRPAWLIYKARESDPAFRPRDFDINKGRARPAGVYREEEPLTHEVLTVVHRTSSAWSS